MATVDSTVTYRDVPGHPGYRVGDDGSVWTCRKQVCIGYHRGTKAVIGDVWRPMKPGKRPNGYAYVKLAGDIKVSIHRLVLEAFVGPCPEGMEACHLDGIRTNNSISNLRWDTHKANAADRIRHGTQTNGTRLPTAKLTDEIVRAAREERSTHGTFFYVLAKKYGVATNVMHNAVTGKTWKHVS